MSSRMPFRISPRVRAGVVLVALSMCFVAVYWTVSEERGERYRQIGIGEVYTDAEQFQSARLVDDGRAWVLERNDGQKVRAQVLDEARETVVLRDAGVAVQTRSSSHWPWLAYLLVLGFVVAVLLLVARRFRDASKNGRSIMALTKTRARLVDVKPTTRFADVGGADEAKVWLRDVAKYLKEHTQTNRLGAKPPRGILLEGPPGVGKTMLARALAGESEVPFFEVAGGEFIELFVGVGASRVRDLFEQARKKAPCVVFIDEIDALGRRRGASDAAMVHQEREQALNQLLVELDGFARADGVVVIAATNRADVLDPALLRPGRFDVRLTIALPDRDARLAILQKNTRDKPLDVGVDLAALATETDRFTGAELAMVCNEAALTAVRRGATTIADSDFAIGKQRMLGERSELTAVDALMIESAIHFSKPAGRAYVEVTFNNGSSVSGELVWATPQLIKVRTENGEQAFVRSSVLAYRSLAGTDAVAEGTLSKLVSTDVASKPISTG